MINTHTADRRDGEGHLTRGTSLNFGIADCLYSHFLKMWTVETDLECQACILQDYCLSEWSTCMYACSCMHTRVYTCSCMYIICVYMGSCMYICMYMGSCIYIYVYACSCMYTRVYTCSCIYICVYTGSCMYIRVYTCSCMTWRIAYFKLSGLFCNSFCNLITLFASMNFVDDKLVSQC